jgi:hypothetical protein
MSLIATIAYTDEIKINVYQGTHGKYFNIEDNKKDPFLIQINYDSHFPLNWILYEKTFYEGFECKLTGPVHCKYCRDYGHYNGVFIGYCSRCADQFNWSRGCGFLIAPDQPPGVEIKTYMKTNIHGCFILDHDKKNSMWETYLKGVTLDQIGDTKLAEEIELCKDMPELIPNDYEDVDQDQEDDIHDEQNIRYWEYMQELEDEQYEIEKARFLEEEEIREREDMEYERHERLNKKQYKKQK